MLRIVEKSITLTAEKLSLVNFSAKTTVIAAHGIAAIITKVLKKVGSEIENRDNRTNIIKGIKTSFNDEAM